MTAKVLDKNEYLTLQLLSYDNPEEQIERFYFQEISTLQVTTLIPPEKKIITSKIAVYKNESENLNEQKVKELKTIGEFNSFFINNSNYCIFDCYLELECGIKLETHDDGEAIIQYPNYISDQIKIIDDIFQKYGIDKKVINALRSNPRNYFTINKLGIISNCFKTFDDWVMYQS